MKDNALSSRPIIPIPARPTPCLPSHLIRLDTVTIMSAYLEDRMAFSVFISRQIPRCGVDWLRARDVTVTLSPVDRPLTLDELIASARASDGLLSMLTDPIGEPFLAACPTLRAVSQFAVGTNNIDLAACQRRGVGVANTPGVLTDATAETAFALLLACARRIVESDVYLRDHATLFGERPMTNDWTGWGPLQFLGQGIVGQTLGIVGAGRIGCRLAKMAAGFDMQLLYTSRRPSDEMARRGARHVELDDLLAQSDFVSMHLPATAETRHLIDARRLSLMKPTAILINTARGSVVDEAALIIALKAGRIFAAGLDVFEHEPSLIPGLCDLPNVVILPHVGSATVQTRDKMSLIAAENLLGMLNGKGAKYPVK